LAAQLVPGAEVVGFEAVVVVRVEVVMVVDDLVEVETPLVLDEEPPPPPPGALNVEPMGPNFMLE
jgi:hypothetical protein